MATQQICFTCTQSPEVLSVANSELYLKLIKEENFRCKDLNSEQLSELFDSKCICLKCAYITQTVVTNSASTLKNIESNLKSTNARWQKKCVFCCEIADNLFSFNIVGQDKVNRVVTQITAKEVDFSTAKQKKVCIRCYFIIVAWNDIIQTIEKSAKKMYNESKSSVRKIGVRGKSGSKRRVSGESVNTLLSDFKKLRNSSEFSSDDKTVKVESKSNSLSLNNHTSSKLLRQRKNALISAPKNFDNQIRHLRTAHSEHAEVDLYFNDKVMEDKKMMYDIPYVLVENNFNNKPSRTKKKFIKNEKEEEPASKKSRNNLKDTPQKTNLKKKSPARKKGKRRTSLEKKQGKFESVKHLDTKQGLKTRKENFDDAENYDRDSDLKENDSVVKNNSDHSENHEFAEKKNKKEKKGENVSTRVGLRKRNSNNSIVDNEYNLKKTEDNDNYIVNKNPKVGLLNGIIKKKRSLRIADKKHKKQLHTESHEKMKRHMPKIRLRCFNIKSNTLPKKNRQCFICRNVFQTRCEKILHELEHNIPFSPRIVLGNIFRNEKFTEVITTDLKKEIDVINITENDIVNSIDLPKNDNTQQRSNHIAEQSTEHCDISEETSENVIDESINIDKTEKNAEKSEDEIEQIDTDSQNTENDIENDEESVENGTKNDEHFKNDSQNNEEDSQSTEKDSQNTEEGSQNTEEDSQNTEEHSQITEEDLQNNEKDSQSTEKDAQSTEKYSQSTENDSQDKETSRTDSHDSENTETGLQDTEKSKDELEKTEMESERTTDGLETSENISGEKSATELQPPPDSSNDSPPIEILGISDKSEDENNISEEESKNNKDETVPNRNSKTTGTDETTGLRNKEQNTCDDNSLDSQKCDEENKTETDSSVADKPDDCSQDDDDSQKICLLLSDSPNKFVSNDEKDTEETSDENTTVNSCTASKFDIVESILEILDA